MKKTAILFFPNELNKQPHKYHSISEKTFDKYAEKIGGYYYNVYDGKTKNYLGRVYVGKYKK